MRSHHTIGSPLFLVVVAILAAPASTSANPLLSGYGGPGQGSQAIVGSTLIGPPGGGGGGAAGGGSAAGSGAVSSAGSSTSSGAATPSTPRLGAQGAGGSAGRSARTSPSPGSTVSTGTRSARPSGAEPTRGTPRESATPSGQTESLGLSGPDLLYGLLTLAALALTAVFTTLLARGGPSGRRRPSAEHPPPSGRVDR